MAATPSVSRIVLTGFMGAGKSTVGPLLAERLGWRFVDADRYLEREAGVTIAELFRSHGEPEFRLMEAKVFAELHQDSSLVIALGGGALETEATRVLLEGTPETCMVLLHAPFETLVERCESQPGAATRPVLAERETLQRRFQARQPYYARARVQVNTQGLTPEGVTEMILEQLQEGSSLQTTN